MVDKTYDTEDPKGLPYRFTHSPTTDEVFILAVRHGFAVLGYFENHLAFHRFLIEGNRTDDLIQDGMLKEAADILRAKQDGEKGS